MTEEEEPEEEVEEPSGRKYNDRSERYFSCLTSVCCYVAKLKLQCGGTKYTVEMCTMFIII